MKITKIPKAKEIETPEYVPYQLCPKCKGEKVIPSISTTNPTKQCDICGGLGIIPMAKI